MLRWRALIVALMVAVGGCATSERSQEPAPPIIVPQSTWRQVDSQIVAASRSATERANTYAHESMESWMDLVYQRTDAEFIPWFTSYWTQQWLTLKVAWYKLGAEGEIDPTVDRISIYLQEQYQDRVLDPVAEEIDPIKVMDQATKLYVQLLGQQIQGIPQRYGVPLDQFDRRLQGIPAIALAPSTTHSASLYQVIHADPLDELPAYVALVDRVRGSSAREGTGVSPAGISTVAKQTSEELAAELVTRGAASAVSALAGRVAGTLISLGVAGFSIISKENARPGVEAHLRKSLNDDFDEEWLELMRNPDTGVMAGVNYLSGQIEGNLTGPDTLPLRYEPIQ
ncbi:hypothetical protein [Metapseudomonas boanensis]|uniref:Lipoprotein n=1 Tax=Metapseudomonas boanensis TaxID=2822138 RepID=A0ABS5XIE3_9GAMM|nr:hypothetical protein [Pseudomonas boanensis]MBT8767459.1 hypothetical protein [Pseudomonas boanensis]